VDGHVTWLAVIAAVNTVIGLAYYLRFAALPFLGIGDRETPARARVALSRPVGAAVALTATATLALSVYPQPVLHAACDAVPDHSIIDGVDVLGSGFAPLLPAARCPGSWG
jgi:NADH:ubiquinone oxidoreductase subunit 2 (subunit N)